MAIGFLLFFMTSAGGVAVDASGHVQVDPAEQASETRGIELLMDANAYYNAGGPEFQVDAAIQKYEAVLADVVLLPQLRQDIVFKLADLHRRRGDLSRWQRSPGDAEYIAGTTDLERAFTYYTELIEDKGMARRPALLADALMAMGDINFNQDRHEEAVECYLSARKLAIDDAQPQDSKWSPQERESIVKSAFSRTMNVIQANRNALAREKEKGTTNSGIADLTRFLSELDPEKGQTEKVNAGVHVERVGGESDGPPPRANRSAMVLAMLGFGFVLSGTGMVLALRMGQQRSRHKSRDELRSGERNK